MLMKKSAIRIKQGERRLWEREIHYRTLNQRPNHPLEKAVVTCVRHSSRCPDYDGLVGSFKFVIDALKTCKIIKDDNMKVIGMPNFYWEYAPEKQGFIEICIEEDF